MSSNGLEGYLNLLEVIKTKRIKQTRKSRRGKRWFRGSEKKEVYILGVDKLPIIKIGIGKPKERVYSLQTACPFKLKVLLRSKCVSKGVALIHEQSLHKILEKQKVNGEWFKLNKKGLYLIGRYMEKDSGAWNKNSRAFGKKTLRSLDYLRKWLEKTTLLPY